MLLTSLCTLVVLATAQTARADVSIDQLVFTEIGDGYAVASNGELEGILDIPAEYNGKPVTIIEAEGFAWQPELTEVNIPSTVGTIENYAFFECINLQKVNLSEGLSSIDGQAFGLCYSLSEINFPSTLLEIGDGAFINCTSLKSIELPEGPYYIGNGCFQESGLEEIYIPQSIEYFNDQAFFVSSLKSVHYNCTLGPWVDIFDMQIFNPESYETATLYVPEASIEKIKKTAPWCYFKDIRTDGCTGIENVDAGSGEPVEIYNLGGVKVCSDVKNLSPGIYIRKQGKERTKIAIR